MMHPLDIEQGSMGEHQESWARAVFNNVEQNHLKPQGMLAVHSRTSPTFAAKGDFQDA